ncbi:MAG: 23S rRNA (guanosine(2251)-2'-O)-methyltransferase RlmB [Rhodospirillales bacterium]|nr:23S rRNA (guanosine(2251)-2'-O)-methyltransferase RlmB [Rhodospirillales bacterium]
MPKPPRSDRPSRPGSRPGRHQPGGSGIWLYGTHAVLAAVANPARRIRRLAAAEGARERLQAAAATAPLARPAVEACERRALEALLPPGAVHQGMAALAAPLPELSLQDLLDRLKDDGRRVRLVVLDQATDPRNVGAVIRSAAAFSAAAVLTQDRHAPSATGALVKAAAGGLERVPLVAVVNLARALRALQEAGFCCIGLDAEAELTLAALPRADRVALVLGSEGRGLRRLVRESCDTLARIPIATDSESLNLSAAAAIALYELAREAGDDG